MSSLLEYLLNPCKERLDLNWDLGCVGGGCILLRDVGCAEMDIKLQAARNEWSECLCSMKIITLHIPPPPPPPPPPPSEQDSLIHWACGTFLDKYIFLYLCLRVKHTIWKKYFLVLISFQHSMVLRSMCPACLHPSIKLDGSSFSWNWHVMLCFTLQYNHFTGWRQFNLDTVKNAVWGRQMFIRLDVPGPRLQSPSIYIPDNFTTN